MIPETGVGMSGGHSCIFRQVSVSLVGVSILYNFLYYAHLTI